MMTEVTVTESQLRVTIHGLDVLWAFKTHIVLPLDHVAGAWHSGVRAKGPWLGAGRTDLLLDYAVAAGPMVVHGRREFWSVHDPERAVTIDLVGEPYERLVVEVRDPSAVVAAINAAARGETAAAAA